MPRPDAVMGGGPQASDHEGVHIQQKSGVPETTLQYSIALLFHLPEVLRSTQVNAIKHAAWHSELLAAARQLSAL